MATISELKSQLNSLKAEGKTESTSKKAGKIANQLRSLEQSGSRGLPEYDTGMSTAQRAYDPAVQTLQGGVSSTKQAFDNLINSIKQSRMAAENQQTAVTSAELGKRGLLPSSSLAQQEITSAIQPISASYAQQEAQTGVQGVQNVNDLLRSIAGVQTTAGGAGLEIGQSALQRAIQQRSLDEQIRQSNIQNALAQRQFEQVTVPTARAQISQMGQSDNTLAVLKNMFPNLLNNSGINDSERTDLENL